jgi:hypothetical protein
VEDSAEPVASADVQVDDARPGDHGHVSMVYRSVAATGAAIRAEQDLGWLPQHTDMLTMIGEERLRRLATPAA